MTRVRIGSARRAKHKKIMKAARGMRGAMSRRYNLAKQKTFKSGVYATRDRRRRKRDFRRLWIIRLNAACRQRGVRYSQFIRALELADVVLDRKILSDMAIADPAAFDAVMAAIQPQLDASKQASERVAAVA
jgi:large subunit ribosomal protein L20